jgi:hypothetical protein
LDDYFFFFAAFLAAFFAPFFGAAVLDATAFLAALGLSDAVSEDFFPKTVSQFFQNSGVVPVLTMGPLMP